MREREIAEELERAALLELVAAGRDQGLDHDAEQLGKALVVRCPSIDNFWFNRVLGLGRDPELGREQLARVIDEYRAAGVTRYFVHLYDEAQPAELPRWLEELGLERYHRSWYKLGRGREGPLPEANTTLQTRPATAADIAALAELFGQCFHMPPLGARLFVGVLERPGWHGRVATDGERVVAGGLLYITGDGAYLAGGATHPDYRGRGAQLALLSERCQLALDHGCRYIVSETGEPVAGEPQHSQHNMARCGLRVLARRHNYAPPGKLWR